MRNKKKTEIAPQSDNKMMDVSASMKGTLRFDDPVNLRINGEFEGTLDTKGTLVVGNKANIKANITGEIISVAGTVDGDIRAFSSLTLDATARLTGDVETPKLSIAEGAVLNGRVQMKGGDASNGSFAEGDWMTSYELAKYLEVDERKINEWAEGAMLPGVRDGNNWIFERSKVDQWIAEGKVKA